MCSYQPTDPVGVLQDRWGQGLRGNRGKALTQPTQQAWPAGIVLVEASTTLASLCKDPS